MQAGVLSKSARCGLLTYISEVCNENSMRQTDTGAGEADKNPTHRLEPNLNNRKPREKSKVYYCKSPSL